MQTGGLKGFASGFEECGFQWIALEVASPQVTQ